MTGSACEDDKKRPTALNLTPARSPSTGSNSSSDSSLKHPRTPRFAEATSVHSPVEPTRSPFADPEKAQVVVQAQPADIGFGYINNRESQVPKTPLRSAMKIPGTPGRKFGNPMSPTFNEAEILEKRELATDKEQARDLKIKTRVRMAKFALRGVNFSCSLIILCMLSSTFAIFNASKGLASQSSLPPWAEGTNTWPQKLVLAMACVSLTACIIVFITFFRRGHKRAEKVNTYYHMFAIGWFIASLVLWGVTAALYQNSRNNSNNKDMWGWSCVNNKRESIFEDQVNYQLICRLQNWAMICIIIEVVIEVLCIILYSVVFYRYYTKRRLAKTMDNRDRARSDLYLAQLRAQSAPNTPGFGPKSPALSQYAMSPRHPPAAYRNLGDIEESPFTPGGKLHEPASQFNSPKPDFKLQAPPKKAPSATPKTEQSPFTPVSGQSPFSPTTESGPSSNNQNTTTIADDEPVYDAVPIPGAYAGQAYKPHLEQR
ncbi:unnamed protein product [Clonostachys chloroleuca]|uniref:Uncharacterized protein n=1 Tax=Clonostachys chloroleuca TaxID=1926264 RepID=A0AA35LTK7_9HYPO|nr:unnamed protein product [Clonostachys chloroleuca]